MKYFNFLMAIFVFFITLGLNIQSIANEPEALCKPESAAESCAPGEHNNEHNNKSHNEHSALSDKMNSLFPEKQQITQLTERPGVVEITAPKFLAKVSGVAKLEWKKAQGANAYHVQVATDPNFKWLVAEDHFVKTNSFEFSKAEVGHKYFWRVAAFNTNNEAMFTKSNFNGSVFVAK